MGIKFKKRKRDGAKISEENATEEIQDFMEENKIFINDLDKDERAGIKNAMVKLARALMDGDIEIKGEPGEKYIVQILSNGQILEYKNKKAVAQQAMAKADENDGVGRLFAFVLAMANKPISYQQEIPNADSSIMRSIALILFS